MAETVTADALNKTKMKRPFLNKIRSTYKLKWGVIFEVLNLQQAKIAQEAGACAVVISDRGVARMPNPSLIKEIKKMVSLPVMAACRVGHSVEAQILEAIGVDFIDENEVLAPADDHNYLNKHNYQIPFSCGCTRLGQALTRVNEGAVLIRTQGDASAMGNIAQTVQNVRSVMKDISVLASIRDDEVFAFAMNISAPIELVKKTKRVRRLPVLQFASGGIATPADAALMMQLGCDGIFVGSEIFVGSDSRKRLRDIVQVVRYFKDPTGTVLAERNPRLVEPLRVLDVRDKENEPPGSEGVHS